MSSATYFSLFLHSAIAASASFSGWLVGADGFQWQPELCAFCSAEDGVAARTKPSFQKDKTNINSFTSKSQNATHKLGRQVQKFHSLQIKTPLVDRYFKCYPWMKPDFRKVVYMKLIVLTSVRTSVTELHVSIKLWVSSSPKSVRKKYILLLNNSFVFSLWKM